MGWLVVLAAGAGGCAGCDPAVPEAPWVIPEDRASQIPRLLSPLWEEPPPPLAIVGAEVTGTEARIRLSAGEAEAALVLRHLGPRGPGAGFGEVVTECDRCEADAQAALTRMAAHFEGRQRELDVRLWRPPSASRPDGPKPPPADEASAHSPGERGLRIALAAVLFLGLVHLVSRRRGRGNGNVHPLDGTGAMLRPIDHAAIIGLAVFAVAPILPLPMEDSTAVYRIATALGSPFGDPGHPFLFYLIVRPFAAISLEPWFVRLPLGAAFVGQVWLVAVASARAGGRTAGLLAGLWFAVEARRRHGIIDVSSWDLGGLFVMGLLLWAVIYGRRLEGLGDGAGWASRKPWVLLLLIVLGGVSSSRLFVVPAAVLVGFLCWELLRRRAPPVPVALITLVVAATTIRIAWMFDAFIAEPPLMSDLLAGLHAETALARTPWMAGPLAAGLILSFLGWRRLSTRFAFFSVAAVLAAIVVAAQSRDQAGYYLGLVTGLWVHLAAVGTATALGWVSRIGPGARIGSVAVASALVLLTSPMPAGRPFANLAGYEHLADFHRRVVDEETVVFTDVYGLARNLAYEALRPASGRGLLAEEEAAARRLRPFDVSRCAPVGQASPDRAPAYVLIREHGGGNPCRDHLVRSCRHLFPLSGTYDYFACPLEIFGPGGEEPSGRNPDQGPEVAPEDRQR